MPQNLWGHVTVTTPTFRKYLLGFMWGLSPGTCLPNLKFVPSAVLQILAFKVPKITGSRDRDHAHFSEIFVRGHVGTIPENTPAKFEVSTFSRFGTDGQTDKQEQAYQKRQGGYMVIAGHRRPDTATWLPQQRVSLE